MPHNGKRALSQGSFYKPMCYLLLQTMIMTIPRWQMCYCTELYHSNRNIKWHPCQLAPTCLLARSIIASLAYTPRDLISTSLQPLIFRSQKRQRSSQDCRWIFQTCMFIFLYFLLFFKCHTMLQHFLFKIRDPENVTCHLTLVSSINNALPLLIVVL